LAVCGLGLLAPWAKATYQASTRQAPSVQIDESDVEGLLRSARGGDYYQDRFDALSASIEASQTDLDVGNGGRGFNLALRRSLDGSRRWRMVPLAAVGETYLIADGYGISPSSPDYDATSNFRNDNPQRLVLSTPDGTVAFYPSSVKVTETIDGRVTTAQVEWESSGRWHASEVSTWTEYGVVFGDDSAATASLSTTITVSSNDGRTYQCDGELANNARPISDMSLPHIDCDTLSDAFGNQLLATYRKPDPYVPELEGSLWPVTLESLSDGKRQVRFSWTKLSESSYQGQIYLDANQNAVLDGDEPFVVYDYGYEPALEEGSRRGPADHAE
jgi:hypothetical protein